MLLKTLLILAFILPVTSFSADWEDAFIEAEHVKKKGHGKLVEKIPERNLSLAETRLLGQWRMMKKGRTRDSYYGPLDSETGRGDFFGIYSEKGEREEQALTWSPDPRRGGKKHMIIRYYADRDSPTPLFKEWVDVPLSGRTMARRNLEDINRIDIYEYLSQNTSPPSKVRRGYREIRAAQKIGPGLGRDLLRAARRLTDANRDLRIISDDYLGARWNENDRARQRLRLQRFTAGEMKRAKRDFKKALRLYKHKYTRKAAETLLKEQGYAPLLKAL